MNRLLQTGRIEETIHFASDGNARLTYALEHAAALEQAAASEQAADRSAIRVRYSPQEIAVVISSQDARRWAGAPEVGLYGQVRTSHGALELAVEKDFACLDKNDAENADTFPNPQQGTVC